MKRNKREGFVYILSNPTMPGILKIGRTVRQPEVRIKEINSATGVAMPFKLEAVIQTKNPVETERLLHELLAPNRINQRREFFKLSIKEATVAAHRAAKHSKARVRRQRSTSQKAFAVQRLVATVTVSVWIATFNPALAFAAMVVCLWAMATRTPSILWDALSIPSIFGRWAVPFMMVLAIYPIATGKVEITPLQQAFSDVKHLVQAFSAGWMSLAE